MSVARIQQTSLRAQLGGLWRIFLWDLARYACVYPSSIWLWTQQSQNSWGHTQELIPPDWTGKSTKLELLLLWHLLDHQTHSQRTRQVPPASSHLRALCFHPVGPQNQQEDHAYSEPPVSGRACQVHPTSLSPVAIKSRPSQRDRMAISVDCHCHPSETCGKANQHSMLPIQCMQYQRPWFLLYIHITAGRLLSRDHRGPRDQNELTIASESCFVSQTAALLHLALLPSHQDCPSPSAVNHSATPPVSIPPFHRATNPLMYCE